MSVRGSYSQMHILSPWQRWISSRSISERKENKKLSIESWKTYFLFLSWKKKRKWAWHWFYAQRSVYLSWRILLSLWKQLFNACCRLELEIWGYLTERGVWWQMLLSCIMGIPSSPTFCMWDTTFRQYPLSLKSHILIDICHCTSCVISCQWKWYCTCICCLLTAKRIYYCIKIGIAHV